MITWKKASLIGYILFLAIVISALAGQEKQWKDPDRWLRTSLSMKGTMKGKPMTEEQVEWALSLPRKTQVDFDSVIQKPDVWLAVSEDEDVAIIFAGGMKEGSKILDIRGK